MDLTKIISVAGKPGLHRVIGQNKQALIVESLADAKRFPVPLSVKVNSLNEISMFTTGDDVPLKDVLGKLHEVSGGGEAADPKSDDAQLWESLLKALPAADRDRIYPSDVRKLFVWYALLLKSGEFDRKDEAPAKDADHKESHPEKKPAEKTAKKKAESTAKVKPSGSSVPKAAAVRRGGQRGA